MFTTVINKIQENAAVKFVVSIFFSVMGSFFLSSVIGHFSSKAGMLTLILSILVGIWVSCAIFCMKGAFGAEQ